MCDLPVRGLIVQRSKLKNLSRGSNLVLFHLKLYSMFQDSSRRSIENGFWRIFDEAQIHRMRFLSSSGKVYGVPYAINAHNTKKA